MRKKFENKFIPIENKIKSRNLFIFALILSWLTFIFYFIFPITFIFWVVIFIILWNKQSNLKWFLLGFSSWTIIPFLSFSVGLFSYFTGNATIAGYGLTRPESYNLNREKRIWYSNSGCMVTGTEILTHTPNNTIVLLMYDLFGVQKWVYKGIYPDKNETKKYLESKGQEVSFSKASLTDKNGRMVSFSQTPLSFNFVFNNKEFFIKGGKIKNDRYPQFLIDCNTARVALVNDELIIFKPIILDNQDYNVTYLADSKTGIIFARYFE